MGGTSHQQQKPRMTMAMASQMCWKTLTCTSEVPRKKSLTPSGFLAPSLWTWSLEPWTSSKLLPSDLCSSLTTWFSETTVRETTGQKDTTPREPNSLSLSSTAFARKSNSVMLLKDSRFSTLLEEELDPEWEPCCC